MAESQEQNTTKKDKGVKEFIRNRNHLVFLAFVVLSFIIWFLNYLNKNLSSELTIKYKFKNLPAAIVGDDSNSGELLIYTSGQGYNLLQKSIEARNVHIHIDLDDDDFKNKNILNYSKNEERAYIVTNDLKPYLSRKIGDKLIINNIDPDTLFFEIVNITEKKVPIDFSNINYTLNKGEKLRIIKSSNDSATIIGQKSILDTINSVGVKETTIKRSRKSSHYSLSLDLPDGVSSIQKDVDIEFEVEIYTETSQKIKIKALNFPSNYDLTILPRYVTVHYSVALSQYDKVRDYDFAATIDYNKAARNCIEIDVVSHNSQVSIIKTDPEICTFLLHKK